MAANITELKRARERLQHLADGYDPDTGELLPQDHECQHPDTVRALFRAADALSVVMTREQARAQTQVRPRTPANCGKDWDLSEDRRLIEGVRSGLSPRDLARRHQRTHGAIRARLEKLGMAHSGQRNT
ncbi:MAG: hypothetical protein AAGG99_03470 [Pseudomonadota bacterium]